MSDALLKETIEVGPIHFELDEHAVVITDSADEEEGADPDEAPFVHLNPQTRRDANQLSMALRKASKRLEEIARTLPAE